MLKPFILLCIYFHIDHLANESN